MDSSDKDSAFIMCKACDLPFTGIEPFEQHVKGKKHNKKIKKSSNKFRMKSPGTKATTSHGDAESESGDDIVCAVCKSTFSGVIPYTQHMMSSGHKKALRKEELEQDQLATLDADADSNSASSDQELDEAIKELIPKPYQSCVRCEKDFSGPESYYQHMMSKSHAKRKRELRLLKSLNEKRNKGLNEEGDCKEIDAVQLTAENLPITNDTDHLECKDCNKVFTGTVSLAQHLVSKSHWKKEAQNKMLEELKNLKEQELEDSTSDEQQRKVSSGSLDDVLTCEICNMAFSGPESAKAHLISKGHQRSLKWQKFLAHNRRFSLQESNRTDHNKSEVENKCGTDTIVAGDEKKSADEKNGLDTETKEVASAPQFGSSTASSIYQLERTDEVCPPYKDVAKINLDELSIVSKGENCLPLYPMLPGDSDLQIKSNDIPNTGVPDNQVKLKPDKKPNVAPIDADNDPCRSDAEEVENKRTETSTKKWLDEGTSDDSRKKKKSTKCKSGVGKIVKAVVDILD